MGGNFQENITIRLEVEESIRRARELSTAILDINTQVNNLRSSLSNINSSLATSFDLAIANARTLNNTLADTVRLQSQMGGGVSPRGAASPFEQGEWYGEGIGGGYSPSSRRFNRLTASLPRAPMPYESDSYSTMSRFRRLTGSAGDTSGYAAIADQLPSSLQEHTNVLRRTRHEVSQTKSGFDSLGESIQRTAMHVVTGIAVWESFRMVQGTITETTRRMLELETVSARIASMSGQSRQAVSQQITTQAIIAAGLYGVSPDQTIQNALLERQVGATGQDIQLARQMAVAYGEKYENIITEIVQSKVRMKQAGVGKVDTANLFDAINRSAPGTFEQKMDALQQGAILGSQFGLEPQQLSVAMLRSAALTETQNIDTVAGGMGRLVGRIRLPDTKQSDVMKQYGIEGTGAERVRQFADTYVEILATKGREAADAFLEPFATGLNKGKDIREFGTYLEQVAEAARDGSVAMGEFNKTLQEQMATSTVSLERIKSTWDTFLLSFTNTDPVQGFFRVLIDGLTSAQQLMTMMTLGGQYERETGKSITPEKNPIIESIQRGAWGVAYPLMALLNGVDNPEFKEWLNKQGMSGATIGKNLLDTVGTPAVSIDMTGRGKSGEMDEGLRGGAVKRSILGFGGYRKTDLNIETLIAKAEQWDKSISEGATLMGQEAPSKVTTGFWDESSKMWKPVVASNEALRFAIDELTKTQKQIAGVFNVPAGGEVLVPFRALQEGFMPSNRVPRNSDLVNGRSGGMSDRYMNLKDRQLDLALPPITLNNNIVVSLDGKTIANNLQQSLYNNAAVLTSGGASTTYY